MAGLGQLAEAHATIDQATAKAQLGGERWFIAELLRIKGELLLRDSTDASIATAETRFLEALEVAEEQRALLWQLRASLSLARLRLMQNRRDDARQILEPLYHRFTEGFKTADLRYARTMLQPL
jgi:predicted ATPase